MAEKPIKGPYASQSCGNCLFWGPGEAKTGHDGGICRRHAPRPRTVFTQENATGDGDEPIAFAYWPDTAETDWCGEWRRDLTNSEQHIIEIEVVRG